LIFINLHIIVTSIRLSHKHTATCYTELQTKSAANRCFQCLYYLECPFFKLHEWRERYLSSTQTFADNNIEVKTFSLHDYHT